jgi:hypothetical protein
MGYQVKNLTHENVKIAQLILSHKSYIKILVEFIILNDKFYNNVCDKWTQQKEMVKRDTKIHHTTKSMIIRHYHH